MNILQESKEETWNLSGNWQLRTVEYKPQNATSLTLLLHGYNERGLRIFRKLRRHLPENSYIIAPNAPYPLPRVKPDRVDFGYAWYFYDPFTKDYQVDQTLALSLLKDLLRQANPQNLPVTIIGFSQGGYLAPLLAYSESNTRHVIGIGCEFRMRFFASSPSFSLDAVHGLSDPIISPKKALEEIHLLKEKGIKVAWHPVAEAKHEISSEVGLTIKNILEQYGAGSL